MPKSLLLSVIVLVTIASVVSPSVEAAQDPTSLAVSNGAAAIISPKAPPEPRRKLPQSPQELYQEIMSDDRQTKARGLSGLVGRYISSDDFYGKLPEASIQAVQLDNDAEPEYIVTLFDEIHDDCGMVADKAPDGWYLVGETCEQHYWVPLDSGPIVDVHGPFVILRNFGHGTDKFQETTVGVYRLWNGQLYKTFQQVEKMHYRIYGDPLFIVDAEANIVFHDIESTSAIEVRNKETKTLFDSYKQQTVGDPIPAPSTCEGYEWVPATFSFERTDNATKAFCK